MQRNGKRNGIGSFLAKKTVKLITLLAAVCLVTFVLLDLSPIDPVTAYVGASTKVGVEQRALIAEHWGLNKPLIERFFAWFTSIIQGDWGTSMIYRRPVLEVIGGKFLSSLALMSIAWLFSGVVGFVLGIISGANEGSAIDKVIYTYCYILISTPTFWLGILFVMIFAVWLGWFPVALSVPIGTVAGEVSLADKLEHVILPAFTLSLIGISNICLHTRQKVIEILATDYVLFAKARGENNKEIIFNHVLKNVSLPAITLQFLSFSELFGGAIFVEQVFSYPGLGRATVEAGLKGDLPLLMGIVIISTVFVYVGNTTADLLYRLIDPRIREAKSA